MIRVLLTAAVLLAIALPCLAQKIEITHGPVLGHVTENSIRVWGRTSVPGKFVVQSLPSVEAGTDVDWSVAQNSDSVATFLENDNTGWIELVDLQPETRYNYRLVSSSGSPSMIGSFKTLPSETAYRNEYNPRGLFNFKFEFGSCASQNPDNGIGPILPTYSTMLDKIRDDIQFAIMNGDWLYEENRDYPVESWRGVQGISEKQQPELVKHAPTVVGVWENYKTYLSRPENLAEWHRYVPSYFTFDDHELINDIWGAGSTGHRNRRTVFRDIGVAAWFDYLGWADPFNFTQDIHFGEARLKRGSNRLVDKSARFTDLNWDEMANLHVHWGTKTAGVDDVKFDVDQEGDPNSKVYAVENIIDDHTLQIVPEAVANGKPNYSIGRRSYGKFTVGNCDYFLLDTKTHREYHDTSNPDKPGLSLLGKEQKEWLMKEMANSEADFFFVFSTVPFLIPHVGAGGYAMADNKDESWTVFIDEREKLISFWEQLDKPVFVLTGDLHNSFAIKITDHIWEFCSGPQNSVNHRISDEGGRPNTGLFTFDQREMDIRWSSFVLDDIPRNQRMYPFYCVVQINNVFNNPQELGGSRWVAYKHPQVIFSYYEGRTGELVYSEAVSTIRK